MTGYGDGLGLYYNDVYPGINLGGDTSSIVVPDANDQEAMDNTPAEDAKKSTGETSNKMIFLAVALIAFIIIFLGWR